MLIATANHMFDIHSILELALELRQTYSLKNCSMFQCFNISALSSHYVKFKMSQALQVSLLNSEAKRKNLPQFATESTHACTFMSIVPNHNICRQFLALNSYPTRHTNMDLSSCS